MGLMSMAGGNKRENTVIRGWDGMRNARSTDSTYLSLK